MFVRKPTKKQQQQKQFQMFLRDLTHDSHVECDGLLGRVDLVSQDTRASGSSRSANATHPPPHLVGRMKVLGK